MNKIINQQWFRVVILFGIVYLFVGITFAEIASVETQINWRLAAWLVCAAAFAVHIAYEHFRQRSLPRSNALHTSLAAAFGAFGLAVAANVHALWVASGNHFLLALALVIWPVMTAIPAFVVALALATGLARWRPKR